MCIIINIGTSREVSILDSNVEYQVPSLNLLLNLDGLKILQEVGADYMRFGVIILNEKNGAITEMVESNCNHKSECSNMHIARRWLNGHHTYKETSWAALIDTLCEIDRRTLAIKIRKILKTHDVKVIAVVRCFLESDVCKNVPQLCIDVTFVFINVSIELVKPLKVVKY